MGNELVPCRICALEGTDKRVSRKGLNGHLGAHKKDGWSRKKYIDRWKDDGAENDFEDYQPKAEHKLIHERFNEPRNAPVDVPPDVTELLSDPNLELLNADERIFYEQFYNTVLQQVDRDEVQMPVIGSLTLDMVVLKRLRRAQLEATGKKTFTSTKELEDAIEKAEKRIQSSMKALCISREMLLKTREQIKSTAAGLISGYLDEIERQTAEVLDALMIDEKRALARSKERIDKMILVHARDLEPEQDDTNGNSTGAVISFEDALQRAGVTF